MSAPEVEILPVASLEGSEGRSKKIHRKPFFMPPSDWLIAFLSLISLTLTGLQFPPGFVLLAVMLVFNFSKNKYDFIIQFTLFSGGYTLISMEMLPVKLYDFGLIASFVGMLIYRKNGVIKKVTIAMLCYFVAMVMIARTSDESLGIQFRTMRSFMTIIFFFIPLLVFAGRDFDIKLFYRKIILYCLLLCIFYIVDCYIINGYVLAPASMVGESKAMSNYYDLYAQWFRMVFPRKYSGGLFLMTIAVFPIVYYYRLNIKYWIMVALALIACRTMTFITSLVACYIIFIGKGKQLLFYFIAAILGVFLLYHIDAATGGFMRVQSTIDQFRSLDKAVDEEDLADFGSSRMAQIIPKWQLMMDLDRLWLGLGFLHPDLTKNPKYIIHNDLYVDISEAEEVATYVEETHISTILNMGVLGFIAQLAFFIYVYFAIRGCVDSKLYLLVLVGVNIAGIGGYEGMSDIRGILVIALALGVILVNNKPSNKLNPYSTDRPAVTSGEENPAGQPR